jgi:hypothetical protein
VYLSHNPALIFKNEFALKLSKCPLARHQPIPPERWKVMHFDRQGRDSPANHKTLISTVVIQPQIFVYGVLKSESEHSVKKNYWGRRGE